MKNTWALPQPGCELGKVGGAQGMGSHGGEGRASRSVCVRLLVHLLLGVFHAAPEAWAWAWAWVRRASAVGRERKTTW